ncbi:HNH endonuclease [Sphingopyxis sp. JAI108]|uniref:HNH endonuclease n=1 Tax=Sphingopyxis sp. JAI108 TaxID=2723060 RepID=UPI0015C9A78D|nr:HNH endonuclease signature motif containing protein [Sphingopyxis sp. JAI108]NYF33797.1 putative Zn-ribbon and HTH transcriptional regulator [Sphingopyxis sp. JAI108]
MAEKPINKEGTAAGRKVLELLRKYPDGLTAAEIRAQIGGDVGNQEQLMRRLRHLRKHYDIPFSIEGGRKAYRYKGEKQNVHTDSGAISGKQRARILNLAKGKCQMCGRTVDGDDIKLQVDHRIPQTWGGLTVDENLWAICVQCNHGKRDFFKSFDPAEMAELIAIESVHERIARFLKMHEGEWVDSDKIEDIANVRERQEDWQKRLRELRYPVVGLDIETTRYTTEQGFVRSRYKLVKWADLPSNHQQLIRAWDNKKKRPEIKLQLGIA